ncbi:MAG: tetratricopeptide repeat protein, partial [Elainellaceae cyanobacterium]
ARRRQIKMVRKLRPGFRRQRRWTLPDGSRLDLWRRRQLPVVVRSLPDGPFEAVQLAGLEIPNEAFSGEPVPVTYKWRGPWSALHDGVVILSWRQEDTTQSGTAQESTAQDSANRSDLTAWLHDHSIGFGRLHPQPIQANQTVLAPTATPPNASFEVVERTAMLPPPDAPAGRYQLTATYLNRVTGETYDLNTPQKAVQIAAPSGEAQAPDESPEQPSLATLLDAGTQLRQLAQALPLGPDALDPVFDQAGRLSLYDPIQRYLQDAEASLTYRLSQNPSDLELLYPLVLAQVLQRDAPGAIATLDQVIQTDDQNPYAYGYLGFVHLYALHPIAAERSLRSAVALAPESTELRSLHALASLMRGNLLGAWREGRRVLNSQNVD